MEGGLAQPEEHRSGRDPLAQRLVREGIEGQLETLREQLREYEALRDGGITSLEVDALARLPDILIRAQTAGGLTQKALAERLGLKEQQIQRYEATRYAGASLERVQAIADALGIRFRGRATLPVATRADGPDSSSRTVSAADITEVPAKA